MKWVSVSGVVLFTVLLVGPCACAKTTPPPLLIQYKCSLEGTITINTTNLHDFHEIAVSQDQDEALGYTPQQSTADCTHALSNISSISSNMITLTKCPRDPTVFVYLTTATLQKVNVIGGRNVHEYKITCAVPTKGIKSVVNASILQVGELDTVTTEKYEFNSAPLTMTITPSSPKIGDTLAVEITVTPDTYYVLPTNCKATGGTGGSEQLELLIDGKTQDSALMEMFNITTPGSATTNMYAFRFQSDATVSIQCSVTVCSTWDCETFYKTTTTPPVGRRRRRSAQDAKPHKTYEVSAAFKVVDERAVDPSSSQAAVRFNPMMLAISLLCMSVVASRRIY